ncbi:hypothetical protein V8F06_011423 [Rhypophila decipiens]
MSLGALTTTFTIPTACAQSLDNIYITNGGVIVEGPLFSSAGASNSCFPRGYKPDRSSYFSPGFCVSGYTPAYSSSAILAGNSEETTVVCCPSVAGKRFFYDTRREPFGFEKPFACKSEYQALTTRVTSIGDGTTETFTITEKTAGAINAHGYQIRFQASDTLTPSSASIPPNPVSTVPRPNDPGTPPPSASSSSSPSSSGLSTGAAAAIGVSATIVIIALVFAGFFFGRRNSQRQQARLDAGRDDANMPNNGTSMNTLKPATGAVGHGTNNTGYEDPHKHYYSAARFEMGASPVVGELPTEHSGLMGGGQRRDGGPPPVELDTSRQE